VGLEIWDNAIPYFDTLHQERNRPKNKIRQFRHSLARQHRYVIKDKLDNYDFFSCWVSKFIFIISSYSKPPPLSRTCAKIICSIIFRKMM